MSNQTRIVFIVSDGTGITAENFSQSILAQFDATFKHIRIPFVDSPDKAYDAVSTINQAASKYGVQAIVFTTLVNPQLNAIVSKANGLILDMFQTFVAPLENALGIKSTHAMNRLHHNADTEAYKNRIEAINYSLAHDDGQSNRNLAEADVILVGISRVGKTPTSLYLAMQYGMKAANYPLIPEDFERGQLPKDLVPYRKKIFGLMINAERLSQMRNERRPGSNYAKLENCRYEINEATSMMKKESIPWVETTSKSIEEIATTVLQSMKSDKTILG
jgi:[pyruvate, water dikinase]-phosphate phosphotransferase / [pyruvate, water dikinase] kinase